MFDVRKSTQLNIVVTLLFLFLAISPAVAMREQQKLSQDSHGGWFGYTVSISGGRAIVGSSWDSDNRIRAHIFERFGDYWQKKHTFICGSGGNRDTWHDGYVSISGDYAIVGVSNEGDNGEDSGAAWIFKEDLLVGRWVEHQKLLAPDGEWQDWFGTSVAIDANTAIVGARGDESGSAYIFAKNDGTGRWEYRTILRASDGYISDAFGWVVSISGDYAIVGAPADDDDGENSGSAYIFKRGLDDYTWSEVAKLNASDAAAGDQFGRSVAIKGPYAIVGAPFDQSWRGSAYIFFRESDPNWSETKIVGSDLRGRPMFGLSVGIDEGIAIVGAPKYDDIEIGYDSGRAYLFKREEGSWNEDILIPSDSERSDEFGLSVSLDGPYALIGAPFKDCGDDCFGAAYVFTECSKTDFNGDCWVDWGDFDHVAQDWLTGILP
ncbi:MAG: FG-GAP repeat protein [Planctomycetota bacterium]|jgi:hypothetical protein